MIPLMIGIISVGSKIYKWSDSPFWLYDFSYKQYNNVISTIQMILVTYDDV